MPKVNYKQADLERGLRAVKKQGLCIDSIFVCPNGDVRIKIKEADEKSLQPQSEEWNGLGDM